MSAGLATVTFLLSASTSVACSEGVKRSSFSRIGHSMGAGALRSAILLCPRHRGISRPLPLDVQSRKKRVPDQIDGLSSSFTKHTGGGANQAS
ncbi:hypothetical protein B0J13DRAFT_322725 [Dactylonectria estremocensis]|uniref:Secreted protein n=1 Tax=Dactylonectria estremocensis TaxID=1079267 RepID=A0A9P9J1N0_9HYPO|nr:hypothetical protein B0J13DRAFT_322725 [Dactylonectria estremocensis]